MNIHPLPPRLPFYLRQLRRCCQIGAALGLFLALSSHRVSAQWASQGQLAPITNFFDLGNDAFEVDAFPGIAAQGGWNTMWTTGFTAPQFVGATVTSDSPLNGAGN